MKYPFQKKSFWVGLTALFLIIFLFPPIKSGWEKSRWEFFFLIEGGKILMDRLICEMAIAFLLNYLGYLIFSKPEVK